MIPEVKTFLKTELVQSYIYLQGFNAKVFLSTILTLAVL